MILTILFASILVSGIIGSIVGKLINDYHPTIATPDWFDTTCFTMLTAGGGCLFAAFLFMVINVAPRQLNYEQVAYEKEVLEYRLDQIEQGNSVTGNELVYNDIVEFNNELRSTKKWANNPWTSWFNNDLIADNVDYIEIPNLYNNGGGE